MSGPTLLLLSVDTASEDGVEDGALLDTALNVTEVRVDTADDNDDENGREDDVDEDVVEDNEETDDDDDDDDDDDTGFCDDFCRAAVEAFVMVTEEVEGKEGKEGKSRGLSTSIFSSASPPGFVDAMDVGPEEEPHEGTAPPLVPFSCLMSTVSSLLLPPCGLSIL